MTLQPKRDRRSMVEHRTERAPSPRPVRAVPDFESFYRSEYRSVVGLAYALSGSRIAAEDITQDAFLAAHKEWDRVAAYDRPEAWAFGRVQLREEGIWWVYRVVKWQQLASYDWDTAVTKGPGYDSETDSTLVLQVRTKLPFVGKRASAWSLRSRADGQRPVAQNKLAS